MKMENEYLLVEAKAAGAELTRVYDKELGRECLWTADPAVWNRHAPVLFPVVGSCRNKEYRYKGVTYPLGQHGFARDAVFEVKEESDTKLVFELKDSEATRKVYPFAFTLTITYELSGKTVAVYYNVKNEASEEPMYFSIGGHPGFLYDGKLEDQIFTFDTDENLDRLMLNIKVGLFSREIQKDFVKGGEPIAVTPHIFDNDALVFHDFPFTTITLKNKNTGHGVAFELKGFPYVGLWSKPGAPYACIEPWFGLADYEDFFGELPEKAGIQTLKAGETFESCYRFTLI